MLTLDDAFAKFRTRLELSDREQGDVSRRHAEVRKVVANGLKIERDFLTGSYARWTKTKPLQDVDVFCVLHPDEKRYRDKHPRIILERVEELLIPAYGRDHVAIDGMAVRVDFGVSINAEGNTDDQVMSIDVVPAFSLNDHFEIPVEDGEWIETDPEIHARLAVDAHAAFDKQWKPLVRMIKKWNRHHGRPVHPSFLLEVMALELLVPPFGNELKFELKSFFADAADRISDEWPDPAGLGSAVSDGMSATEKDVARMSLLEAEALITQALSHARMGRNEEALRTWRSLFGPLFPLS